MSWGAEQTSSKDDNAVEMLRVWIANKRLGVSMNVGMYKEATDIPEEKAWGILLADVARRGGLQRLVHECDRAPLDLVGDWSLIHFVFLSLSSSGRTSVGLFRRA